MKPGPNTLKARRRRGLSLLEVLIVIVILSFGLVGLVGLQARAVQFSVGAEDSNRAALLASDLAARMWGAGTVSLSTAEVDAWKARVADTTGPGLPNGAGDVAVAAGVATVTVTWRAPHEPVGTVHRYVTQVQM
jgi:type IV pilus assembly protein PilV